MNYIGRGGMNEEWEKRVRRKWGAFTLQEKE